jgi:hypothetical protein
MGAKTPGWRRGSSPEAAKRCGTSRRALCARCAHVPGSRRSGAAVTVLEKAKRAGPKAALLGRPLVDPMKGHRHPGPLWRGQEEWCAGKSTVSNDMAPGECLIFEFWRRLARGAVAHGQESLRHRWSEYLIFVNEWLAWARYGLSGLALEPS